MPRFDLKRAAEDGLFKDLLALYLRRSQFLSICKCEVVVHSFYFNYFIYFIYISFIFCLYFIYISFSFIHLFIYFIYLFYLFIFCLFVQSLFLCSGTS